jgi:hypothetical protein
MNTNPEHFPKELFDWIEALPFDALSLEQQIIVQQCISEEEYNDMYIASNEITKNIQHTVRKDYIKGQLLSHFDQHYPNQKVAFSVSKSYAWKVASIVLFCSTILLSYLQLNKKVMEQTKIVVKRDTVYLEKELKHIPPLDQSPIQPDPIASKKVQIVKHVQPKNNNKPQFQSKPNLKIESESPQSYPLKQDFHIVSIDESQRKLNSTKRNSMKDDSLERNYKFVSL